MGVYFWIDEPPYLEYLLIGGGGGGGNGTRNYAGGGGSAGCVEACCNYFNPGEYCIVIGAGGTNAGYPQGNPGGASCFGNICVSGGPGGLVPGQGHQPAGDGAGGAYSGFTGGIGIMSDISGSCECYAGGGGGCGGSGSYGGGNGGGNKTNGCPATTYGSGGGGGGYCCRSGANGCQGVFITRYPTACGYNITGGCKYTCGDYTINCFTSDGTLTIN